jgi:ribonuclease-3
MTLDALQQRLGYRFSKPELLQQALTHRSHSAQHNERLEFLGDSVLNCAVADMLFGMFGKLDEGDLSRVRANLVKQQALYEIAQMLQLSDALRLGEGELKSGGFRRPRFLPMRSRLSLVPCFSMRVRRGTRVDPQAVYSDPGAGGPAHAGQGRQDAAPEYLQGHKIALPQYNVIATHGAAHSQQFEVECIVPKLEVRVFGTGASRRAAEQAAAKLALDEVQKLVPQLLKRSRAERTGKTRKQPVPPDPQLSLRLKE